MTASIDAWVNKRRERWDEGRGIEYDEKIRTAAISDVLSSQEERQKIISRPYLLIELCFVIVDKKKETVPFFLNAVQKQFLRTFEDHGGGKPYFILKGRQQGFTSLITAMQLSYAIVRRNFSGFTLADTTDNSRAIFTDKAKATYNAIPELLHPREKYNSSNELFFDKLNSSWRVSTATDNVGRSRTLNFVHYSEVAFYDCDLANLQKSIGEAATSDACVFYETTANGYNQAKDLWDSGACHNLFFGWWLSDEYTSTDYEYIDRAKGDAWLTERVRLLAEWGLSREQIAWYCKKYASYLDKNSIKQEYPCTPEEAFVASGYSIFDMDLLTARMAQVQGQAARDRIGVFTYKKVAHEERNEHGEVETVEWTIEDIAFEERADGCIRIHEEPRVQTVERGGKTEVTALCPYVIGGDTAGSGIDFFTAKVVDNTNGHTAATLRVQRIDEDLYAEQLYCLGKYYHDAMIGVEVNYSRQPVRVLERLRYVPLYLRERLDAGTNKILTVPGFETTERTKKVILAELVEAFREDPAIECDIETLREMTTFVKQDNGSQSALAGAHDDLVMALAIAHHVRGSHARTWQKMPEPPSIVEKFFGKETTDESFAGWDE